MGDRSTRLHEPLLPGGPHPPVPSHMQPTGHDWCIIKLAFPGRILGFNVDTSFFTGNFAPRCSVQAATVDDEPVRAWVDVHRIRMGVCVVALDTSELKLTWINPTVTPKRTQSIFIHVSPPDKQEAMTRLAAARMDPGAASGKMGSRATEEEIKMYVRFFVCWLVFT